MCWVAGARAVALSRTAHSFDYCHRIINDRMENSIIGRRIVQIMFFCICDMKSYYAKYSMEVSCR